MAACHILQDEIYPSQIVDDTLDTSLAPTSATLEEDLNYIRSVLKAIHGGSTWYDVGTGVADLLSDFPVEHYTTSENPAKAGQHKDVNADSLTTPLITVDTSITFSTTNYVILNETTGPDGQAGSRLWIDGPNDAAGAATGIVFGPKNDGEYFNNFRVKAGRLDFETNSGYISIQTDSSSSTVLKVLSTSIDKNFEVFLSDTEIKISPRVNTLYQQGELKYNYSSDSWNTTKFRATNPTAATLATTDSALEVGDISGGGGLKIGGTSIVAVQNTNQASQLLLNPEGISEVVTWSGVSAAGTFPLRVGSEGFGVWHEGNQGHGSGLDADTVDGRHLSEFSTISGSIRATSNVFGEYHVATIEPNFDVSTRVEEYHSSYVFHIQYKLKGLSETYWARVVVNVIYDTSSGAWLIKSMNANIVGGTLNTFSSDIRLIQGNDILLKKTPTVVSGTTHDFVDIFIKTAANEVDIFEITTPTSVSNVSLATKPTKLTMYDATSVTSSGCTPDTCVAGKNKNTKFLLSIVKSLSPSATISLKDGLMNYYGDVFYLAENDSGNAAYLISAKRNEVARITAPAASHLSINNTHIAAYSLSTANTTDASLAKITIGNGFVSVDGGYQTISTASIARIPPAVADTLSVQIQDSAVYSTLNSIKGFSPLPYTAYNASDIGMYLANTGNFANSITGYSQIRIGGFLSISGSSVYASSISLSTTDTSSINGFTTTSAFVRNNQAVYGTFVVDTDPVSSTNTFYIVRSILSTGSGGPVVQSTVAYEIDFDFPPTFISSYDLDKVKFITEHPNDGTKAIIAHITTDDHLKVAFVNDFSALGGASLVGLDIALDASAGSYNGAIKNVQIVYPEEASGPVFLVRFTYYRYGYLFHYLLVIDGTTWEYFILELPNRTESATAIGESVYNTVAQYLAHNGQVFIPTAKGIHAEFNPYLEKLNLESWSSTKYKNRFDTTLTVTQGSLGMTATSNISFTTNVNTSSTTPTSNSTSDAYIYWNKDSENIYTKKETA